MYDCIIIGKGPAGISAALYTARAGLGTLILAKAASPLEKADWIDNYFGFANGISGAKLLSEGEKQAARFGAEFKEDEVVQLTVVDAGNFAISGTHGECISKAVIIASGLPYKRVKIGNFEKYTGKGVSFCTLCDGFFYKGMKVVIVGSKDFALHEALEMKELAKEVKIFTNGKKLELSDGMREKAADIPVNTNVIASFEGSEFLERIRFEDGSEEEADGVFMALESASGTDFARQLGVITDGTAIVVDKGQKTNVDGIYAAGDCTGGIRQISVAAAQGAVAGKNASEYIRFSKK